MNQNARNEIKNFIKDSLTNKLSGEIGRNSGEDLSKVVEENTEVLLSKYEDSLLAEKVSEKIKALKPGFFVGVWQSLLGSICMFVVIGLCVIILIGFNFDFFEAFQKFIK